MIVRLKVRTTSPTRVRTMRFQFYDSPIKSPSNPRRAAQLRKRFNSMIVRLKGLFQIRL